MWYSAPVCFNDPYDCDFAIDENDTINTLLSSSFVGDNTIKMGSPEWTAAYIAAKKNFPILLNEFNCIKSSIGIACLSENYDSVLMWSHYANNHKGMCIEYNLVDFNRVLGFTPIPVIYSKERNVLRKLRVNSLDQDIMDFFIKSLVCKEDSWKYENEWRIVRDDKACSNQWNEEKHGALLDSISPTSVILGYNAEPQFEEKKKKKCKYEGVRVYKMEKGTDNYMMKKSNCWNNGGNKRGFAMT